MTIREPASARAARAWCRIYTRGLPSDARDDRRRELESDMWEHLHDPDEVDAPKALAGRFIRGIPADVRWRYRTLLDSRGARQRSQAMETTPKRSWWALLTTVAGAVLLVLSLGTFVAGGGSESSGSGPLIGGIVGAAAGALVLGGLARRRTHVVSGSQLVAAGAVLSLAGGLDFIPVGILVLISGFWTGNLQLSTADDAPDLRPSPARQDGMTRHWYVWLGVAAACFAVGWVPLVLDDPDDLGNAGYFIWALSWLFAIVTGGIGLILAGLRAIVRHRTRLA